MISRASELTSVINHSLSTCSQSPRDYAWRTDGGLRTRGLQASWHHLGAAAPPRLRRAVYARHVCRLAAFSPKLSRDAICSHRLVAFDRNPMHNAALPVIVVERVVL